MVNVIIGGDICPIRSNLASFKKGEAINIFNDLLEEFEKADLTIVNMECPLVNENTPIMKSGAVLGVESSCINGLTQAKIDLLNLANNHIMDHGAAGLKNTIEVSETNGISTVGAGENLDAARRILIYKFGTIRIGILAVAEHEFSIATENSWGANPLDLIDYTRNIRSQRANFDYLIVLLHGGNEYYPFPSPRLKEVCHFMIEMGANAIIAQHTHCPGCYEEYKNSHIVYGQGNLIFDVPNKDKSFYEGFLVKLSISEDFSSTMDTIPYSQSNSHIGARKMGRDEEQLFRESFKKRSIDMMDNNFLKNQWLQFCKKKKNNLLSKVLGHNRVLKKLNQKGLLLRYFYTKKALISLQNVISCEAHREILETIFNHKMI